MHTIEIVLPPQLDSSLDTTQRLPEHFASLVDRLVKEYHVNIVNYNDAEVYSNNIKLFCFCTLEQFSSNDFVSYTKSQTSSNLNKSLALLDFRPPSFNMASVIYFKDIVIFDENSDDSIDRVFSAVKRFGRCFKKDISSNIVKTFFKMSFVGRSAAYQQVVEQVHKYSKCQAPVLIEGETGTGKEALARAIHYFSENNMHGFIPVNCAAIPDSLFESELFGHEKGAFTHAQQKHPGLIELAEGGTLFLDEVDALSEKAQSGLLRFLQTGEVRSVGGTAIRKIKTRVVSATNTQLSKTVERSQFRADLMFRLNVLSLSVPPLRRRIEDIEPIVQHLLQRFENKYQRGQKLLHPQYLKWIKKKTWPGNVRELENCLLRKYLLNDSTIIALDGEGLEPDETQYQVDEPIEHGNFQEAKDKVIDQFTAHYISCALEKTAGNVTNAARLAGKERRAFGKLMKKYCIDAKTFVSD